MRWKALSDELVSKYLEESMAREVIHNVLVLSGGGIRAAAFEIGVLQALETLYPDVSLSSVFDLIIGTSAGSFVGALVAQGFTARELAEEFLNPQSPFFLHSSDIYRVNWLALIKGLFGTVTTAVRGLVKKITRSHETGWIDVFYQAFHRLPMGFLNIEPLEQYLCRLFEDHGFCNDFHNLATRLWIPVTDLDTGERLILGQQNGALTAEATVCRAVTASSAIPHLFGPIVIANRLCVDGVVAGGLNMDLALIPKPKHVMIIHAMSPMLHAGSVYCKPTRPGEPYSCTGMGPILEQSNRISQYNELHRYLDAIMNRQEAPHFVVIEPRQKVTDMSYSMHYAQRLEMVKEGYQTVMERAGDGLIERMMVA